MAKKKAKVVINRVLKRYVCLKVADNSCLAGCFHLQN